MGAVTLHRDAQIVAAPPTYSNSHLDLIRRTVAQDCNATEFDLFMEVARRVGLDPFRKQICAIVYSKDKPDKRKMSIITEIGGYRSIANRSGLYRPDENEPEITYLPDLKSDLNPLGIERAVVTVHRYGPDGQWHPIRGTAYWDEFAPIKDEWGENEQGKWKPTGKQTLDKTGNWFRMARVMIAKCAEAQALRKGWPEDLSGVYIREEMDQAAAQDMSATQAADAFRAEQAQARIGTASSVFIGWRAGEPNEAVPAGKMVELCDQFFKGSESIAELSAWEERNRIALKDFWARHKSDALQVKAMLEKRVAALSA